MNEETHYDVLGVPESATVDDLKAARNRLLHKHHPDKAAGPAEATEFTRIIIEAYQCLRDPVLRAQYDEELGRQRASQSRTAPRPARHSPAAASDQGTRYNPYKWWGVASFAALCLLLAIVFGSKQAEHQQGSGASTTRQRSDGVNGNLLDLAEDKTLSASMVEANESLSDDLLRTLDDDAISQCLAVQDAEEVRRSLTARSVDLNGDGVVELVVAATRSPDGCMLCGNRRCNQWIVAGKEGRYRSILTLEGADNVAPLLTEVGGYRDLAVVYPVGNGDITKVARFNGSRYVESE